MRKKELKRSCVLNLFIVLTVFLSGCGGSEDLPGKDDDDNTGGTTQYTEFRVMSFNLRNEVEGDPQTLDERKGNILKVILENTPDILGVQEIAADWMSDWLCEQLNTNGYDKYLSSGQFGSPKIIFYKRSRFTRTKEGTFQMQYADNRSGTWAILLDNDNKKSYFVCNSHWTTASSSDRVLTAQKIVEVVKNNYNNLPLIVLGDFNAVPGTPEIASVKNNGGLNLSCAHNEKGETYHEWSATGKKKIDWILYSKKLSVKSSSVIKTSYNGFWPSDHWPILAVLKLNTAEI